MNYHLIKSENLGESLDPSHSSHPSHPSHSIVSNPHDPSRMTRIQELEKSDADIEHVKTLIATCVGEMTKEKQISRLKFDDVATNFKRTVQGIEDAIDGQLNHLLQLSVGGNQQTTSWENRQKLALAKDTNLQLHLRLKELLNKFDFPTDSEPQSPNDSVAEEPEFATVFPKDEPMSPGEEL